MRYITAFALACTFLPKTKHDQKTVIQVFPTHNECCLPTPGPCECHAAANRCNSAAVVLGVAVAPGIHSTQTFLAINLRKRITSSTNFRKLSSHRNLNLHIEQRDSKCKLTTLMYRFNWAWRGKQRSRYRLSLDHEGPVVAIHPHHSDRSCGYGLAWFRLESPNRKHVS